MITKSKEHESRPLTRMPINMSNKYDVTCNYCTTGFDEYEAKDWVALMEIMRLDGWKSIHDEIDGYKHKCPDCAAGGLDV